MCSWGTKGSTTVSTDLGVVKSSGDEKDKVDVDIPVDEKDIDAAYEDAKHVLAQCVCSRARGICSAIRADTRTLQTTTQGSQEGRPRSKDGRLVQEPTHEHRPALRNHEWSPRHWYPRRRR